MFISLFVNFIAIIINIYSDSSSHNAWFWTLLCLICVFLFYFRSHRLQQRAAAAPCYPPLWEEEVRHTSHRSDSSASSVSAFEEVESLNLSEQSLDTSSASSRDQLIDEQVQAIGNRRSSSRGLHRQLSKQSSLGGTSSTTTGSLSTFDEVESLDFDHEHDVEPFLPSVGETDDFEWALTNIINKHSVGSGNCGELHSSSNMPSGIKNSEENRKCDAAAAAPASLVLDSIHLKSQEQFTDTVHSNSNKKSPPRNLIVEDEPEGIPFSQFTFGKKQKVASNKDSDVPLNQDQSPQLMRQSNPDQGYAKHLVKQFSNTTTESFSSGPLHSSSQTSSNSSACNAGSLEYDAAKLPFESEYEYVVRMRRAQSKATKRSQMSRTGSIESSSSGNSYSPHSPSDPYRVYNQTTMAENVLINLGFCGSDSFIPERFARDWYSKIMTARSERFHHNTGDTLSDLDPVDYTDVFSSKDNADDGQGDSSLSLKGQEPLNTSYNKNDEKSLEHDREALIEHLSNLSPTRRLDLQRSATILTYQQDDSPRGKHDSLYVPDPHNSIADLRSVLERQAIILKSGKGSSVKQRHPFVHQKSLPVSLDTYKDDEVIPPIIHTQSNQKVGGDDDNELSSRHHRKSTFEKSPIIINSDDGLSTSSSSASKEAEEEKIHIPTSVDFSAVDLELQTIHRLQPFLSLPRSTCHSRSDSSSTCSSESAEIFCASPSQNLPSIVVNGIKPSLKTQSSASLEVQEIMEHSGDGNAMVMRNSLSVEPALISVVLSDVADTPKGFKEHMSQSGFLSVDTGLLVPKSRSNSISSVSSPIPLSPVTVIEMEHLDNVNDSMDLDDGMRSASFDRSLDHSTPSSETAQQNTTSPPQVSLTLPDSPPKIYMSPPDSVSRGNNRQRVIYDISESSSCDHNHAYCNDVDKSEKLNIDDGESKSHTVVDCENMSRYKTTTEHGESISRQNTLTAQVSSEDSSSTVKDIGINASDGQLSPLVNVNCRQSFEIDSPELMQINGSYEEESPMVDSVTVLPPIYNQSDVCLQIDDGTLSPIMFDASNLEDSGYSEEIYVVSDKQIQTVQPLLVTISSQSETEPMMHKSVSVPDDSLDDFEMLKLITVSCQTDNEVKPAVSDTYVQTDQPMVAPDNEPTPRVQHFKFLCDKCREIISTFSQGSSVEYDNANLNKSLDKTDSLVSRTSLDVEYQNKLNRNHDNNMDSSSSIGSVQDAHASNEKQTGPKVSTMKYERNNHQAPRKVLDTLIDRLSQKTKQWSSQVVQDQNNETNSHNDRRNSLQRRQREPKPAANILQKQSNVYKSSVNLYLDPTMTKNAQSIHHESLRSGISEREKFIKTDKLMQVGTNKEKRNRDMNNDLQFKLNAIESLKKMSSFGDSESESDISDDDETDLVNKSPSGVTHRSCLHRQLGMNWSSKTSTISVDNCDANSDNTSQKSLTIEPVRDSDTGQCKLSNRGYDLDPNRLSPVRSYNDINGATLNSQGCVRTDNSSSSRRTSISKENSAELQGIATKIVTTMFQPVTFQSSTEKQLILNEIAMDYAAEDVETKSDTNKPLTNKNLSRGNLPSVWQNRRHSNSSRGFDENHKTFRSESSSLYQSIPTIITHSSETRPTSPTQPKISVLGKSTEGWTLGIDEDDVVSKDGIEEHKTYRSTLSIENLSPCQSPESMHLSQASFSSDDLELLSLKDKPYRSSLYVVLNSSGRESSSNTPSPVSPITSRLERENMNLPLVHQAPKKYPDWNRHDNLDDFIHDLNTFDETMSNGSQESIESIMEYIDDMHRYHVDTSSLSPSPRQRSPDLYTCHLQVEIKSNFEEDYVYL